MRRDHLLEHQFPTDIKSLEGLLEKKECQTATNPGMYLNAKSALHVYRIISGSRESNEELIALIDDCLKQFGEYDCRIGSTKDKNLRYTPMNGKKFKAWTIFIANKIHKQEMTFETGYYILCRTQGNHDYKLKLKEELKYRVDSAKTIPTSEICSEL